MSPMPVGTRHRSIESISSDPASPVLDKIRGSRQTDGAKTEHEKGLGCASRGHIEQPQDGPACPAGRLFSFSFVALLQKHVLQTCAVPHFLHQFRFLSLTRLHPFLSCRHSFVHLCHFASFPDAVRDMQECCKNICSCFMLCFPHLVGAGRKGREASMGTDSIYDSLC